MINRLVPSAHKSARIAKISILKLEGIVKKKNPMSVATMSRYSRKELILGYVPKKTKIERTQAVKG